MEYYNKAEKNRTMHNSGSSSILTVTRPQDICVERKE
jgi:hypothetical protein